MRNPKGQFGFFDLDTPLDKIHQLNDFLPKLNRVINGELFRNDLNKVREKERRSNAGRPFFDVVLMFKILYRNKPLTESQKAMNRVKSKVRCRDDVLRTIGFARARFWIGLRNLAYNRLVRKRQIR